MATKWVVFGVGGESLGVRAESVQEMVMAAGIHENPLAPHQVRGMMRLRESVFPVLDVRVCLDIKSRKAEIEELVALLEQRQQDHVRWVSELRASVEQNREFTLTTDPHKCAFGKWYDAYKPESMAMRIQLEKFDRPHKVIHAIAHEVEMHRRVGDLDSARAVVERAWSNELSALMRLFSETKDIVRAEVNDIVLVFFAKGRRFGLLVDSVDEIRDIDERDIQFRDTTALGPGARYVHGIARIGSSAKILVDLDALAESLN